MHISGTLPLAGMPYFWRVRPRFPLFPPLFASACWLRLCLGGLLALLSPTLLAQQLHREAMQLHGDTLRVQHPPVVPGSLRWADGKALSFREANWVTGVFLLKDSIDRQIDTVLYQQLTPLKQTLALRQVKAVKDTASQYEIVDVMPSVARDSLGLFSSQNSLRRSGTLTRGITVGNARGATVTSGIRLQLDGDLGDGLMLQGNLSDDNLPVQPEGNTSQLSDFDRIFFKLSKGSYSLLMGDFDIRKSGTSFGNFYRNVQGVQGTWRPVKPAGAAQPWASFSAASAKGKFNTNSFAGREGDQGPYRLTGKNGERFFMILAGSERVLMNGNLLKRGENEDYVINYNTAEIIFTSKQVITATTRIVVDFEYNDRYFSRSLVVAQAGVSQTTQSGLKAAFTASYARDADNPNAPFDNAQAFEQVRDSLSNIGDTTAKAITTGAYDLGWSADVTRYEKRDSTVAGTTYTVFLYSQNAEKATWQVSFTYLGKGQGHYLRDSENASSLAYKWLAPDSLTGKLNGDYEPVQRWVLPQRLEALNLRADLSRNRWKAFAEVAASRNDQNLLSDKDDGDNNALAVSAGISGDSLRIKGDSLRLKVSLQSQWVAARFTNIDRVYKAEYGRVWNFDDSGPRRNELLSIAQLGLSVGKRLQTTLETGIRATGPGRLTWRSALTWSSRYRLLAGTLTATALHSRDDSAATASRWYRAEGDLYAGDSLRIGSKIWCEYKRESGPAGALQAGSFAFADFTPYVSHKTRRTEQEFTFNYRAESGMLNGAVVPKLSGITARNRVAWRPSPSLFVQHIVAWRQLAVFDTAFITSGLTPGRVITTNLQASYSPKSRWFTLNGVYEAAAEKASRREVDFQRVGAGLGQYIWVDDNGDEIRQVNEFVLAQNANQGEYIRVVSATLEQIPAIRVSVTGNAQLDANAWMWAKKRTPKRLMGKVLGQTRFQSNWRVEQMQRQTGDWHQVLLQPTRPGDTTQLSSLVSVRNDLTFFQNNPGGDLKCYTLQNTSRQFLSAGEETVASTAFGFTPRLTVSMRQSLELDVRNTRKRSQNAVYANRNYFLQGWEARPRYTLQTGGSSRLIVGLVAARRQNIVADTVGARIGLYKCSAEWTRNLGRNALRPSAELSYVTQTGDAGSLGNLEARDGLQPGFNLTLRTEINYFLLDDLLMTASYEGRKLGELKIAHTLRVQVQAFF